MELALQLAERGFGSVEPNPMVGCVVVRDDQILGQGWHRKFGGPHAEVNALADCRKNGHNPAGATMCVTLEPCCHHGKTAPCVDEIIKAGIAKVVIAMEDPTEKVGGKGVERLREAQIKVTLGVCEKRARVLNPAFIRFARTGRPWVILKWAQTIDGKLASSKTSLDEEWISGEQSRKDVHKIRRSCQGILVGVNTVISDDPLLTARPDKGRKLLRVVLDTNLRIPLGCRLLKTINEGPVLIVTTGNAITDNQPKAEEVKAAGAEVLAVPTSKSGVCDLGRLLDELGKRDIQRLLVEGGQTVIKSFLEDALADEVIVYIAPKLFGDRGGADISAVVSGIGGSLALHNSTTSIFGPDVRIRGFLRTVNEF
jgi:diaminohydroxyphosphoribosylaminopyrimidine deaminase/5-amino-6-(5-phosphoribosylamino)uracil reductase